MELFSKLNKALDRKIKELKTCGMTKSHYNDTYWNYAEARYRPWGSRRRGRREPPKDVPSAILDLDVQALFRFYINKSMELITQIDGQTYRWWKRRGYKDINYFSKVSTGEAKILAESRMKEYETIRENIVKHVQLTCKSFEECAWLSKRSKVFRPVTEVDKLFKELKATIELLIPEDKR